MKILRTAAVLLSLGTSPAWSAADPQLLGLLMPDAKLIAGVQLDQAKASPFGQFVLSQAGPNAEFDKLKAATGFDPRTDLSEMVAGATGSAGGLVVGRGAFQPSRIVRLAREAGAKVEDYRGLALIGSDKQDSGAVAFLDGITVVIGPPESVRSAVDRWVGGGRSGGALIARASDTSATSQAWAVATALSELQGPIGPNASPEAQMVQSILSKVGQLSGGLKFGETITMHGQVLTSSAQDAQALADVLQFAVSMAAPKSPLPLMPQLSVEGSAVNFTVTLTEQQAEELFKPATAARTAIRAARK